MQSPVRNPGLTMASAKISRRVRRHHASIEPATLLAEVDGTRKREGTLGRIEWRELKTSSEQIRFDISMT